MSKSAVPNSFFIDGSPCRGLFAARRSAGAWRVKPSREIYAECDPQHNIASVKTASFMRQAERRWCFFQALGEEFGSARRADHPYYCQAASMPIRSEKAMNSGCSRTRRIGSISAQSDIRQYTLAGVIRAPRVLKTMLE